METELNKLILAAETRVTKLSLQRSNIPKEMIDRSELHTGSGDVQIGTERNDEETFQNRGRKLKLPTS